jgi:hypothetical protein
MFIPSGPTIEVVARSCYLRFAQLGFSEAGTSIVRIDDVSMQLSRFIDAVLSHMTEKGITSEAHEAWKRGGDLG